MLPLKLGSQVKNVRKIIDSEFTDYHHKILSSIIFDGGKLIVPDERWSCEFLGAGEEKAVFCICDHNNCVFALEAIDERYYLNGRYVGGKYFFNKL